MDPGHVVENTSEGLLDEALTRLGATGPTYHGRLANHGPMACEALVRLGRADAVTPWLDAYLPDLEPAPQRGRVIEEDDRGEALGSFTRYPDWLATFTAELADEGWAGVLERWLPRLVPGALTGGTHGLIRTAHATRALEVHDSPARKNELAAALAYWAASFQCLPDTPRPGGSLSIIDAVARLPLLPENARGRGRIHDEAAKAGGLVGFPAAIDALARPASVEATLSELTQVMAAQYLANAETSAIAFVHGVTAPAALRLLLPHLKPADQGPAFARVWQVCGAVHAAYSTAERPAPTHDGEPADRAALVDAAVHIGGAHAIKLTEACLREHARNPTPVYLQAAANAAGRLAY